MVLVSQDWADSIADVSLQYMNATVEIRDPSLQTSVYDVETGGYVFTGDPVVATNVPARVQPVRLSVDSRGGSTSNPSGEVRVRVQIPRADDDGFGEGAFGLSGFGGLGKISRGWQVRVLTSERNPELLDYLFVVDANVNSSWRASNTVECSVNVESNPEWSA